MAKCRALSLASSGLSQSGRRCLVKKPSPSSCWGHCSSSVFVGVGIVLELSVILFAIDFVLNKIDLQKAVTVGEEGKINNLCVLFYQVVFATVLWEFLLAFL